MAASEGKVKKIVRDKGYGFIRDTQGKEWFFHKQDLDNKQDFELMQEGDSVTFMGDTGNPKGPRAQDVRLD